MKKTIIITIIFIIILSHSLMAQAQGPQITSEYAILIDAETGKILYEKNAFARTYPASTTKIMTALVTLENSNLTDMVDPSTNIFNISPNSTKIFLHPNEIMTIEELLYGLMLPSGNDAAIAIAEHISGSVEEFTDLMTRRAKELGAKDTNFINPHGLNDSDHYTTAYDLALITKKAMEIEIFRKIVSTFSYTLRPTNKYDQERLWHNTNRLINEHDRCFYEFATGIKTGYTTPAGSCLVSSAKIEDMELIAVVFKGKRESFFQDSKSLLSYGFDNYEKYSLINKGDYLDTVEVLGSRNNQTVDLLADKELTFILDNTTKENYIKKTIYINEEITAPIKKGDILGRITYTVKDEQLSVNLIASKSIEKKSLKNILDTDNTTPLRVWIAGAIVLYVSIRFFYNIRRYKKRRYRY